MRNGYGNAIERDANCRNELNNEYQTNSEDLKISGTKRCLSVLLGNDVALTQMISDFSLLAFIINLASLSVRSLPFEQFFTSSIECCGRV